MALARAIDHDNPPAFIASALYYCCQLSPHDILLGSVPYGKNVVQLERRDLAACMAGRALLLEADKAVRMPLLRAYTERLCRHDECIDGVRYMISDWVAEGRFARFTALRSSGAWFEEHAERHPKRTLCHKCEGSIEDAIDEERKKVFRNLGRFLRLDGWQAK